MSIHSPKKNWFRGPHGAERAWLGLALIWCIIMSLAMPYWHFKGKQNSTGKAYRVEPADFVKRVEQFVTQKRVRDEVREVGSGDNKFTVRIPVVEAEPGGHAYLLGTADWRWYPVLQLKKGQEYYLHVSSDYWQHGFSLLPLNMNFQVLPGYDHVLEITPTRAGEYQIICNEFCGIGHHRMTGKIIVTE